jgi:hypothetical protein
MSEFDDETKLSVVVGNKVQFAPLRLLVGASNSLEFQPKKCILHLFYTGTIMQVYEGESRANG